MHFFLCKQNFKKENKASVKLLNHVRTETSILKKELKDRIHQAGLEYAKL